MKYVVRRIKVEHEDARRKLRTVFNGDNFIARQIKILEVKTDCVLGNHYHNYAELFYVLKGEMVYHLEDVNKKDYKRVVLVAGEVLIISPRIAHTAEAKAGTITIEATEIPYISAQCNDVHYEVKHR